MSPPGRLPVLGCLPRAGAAPEEQTLSETDQLPSIRLQRMYVKDLSFENPGAPEAFRGPIEPQIELRLGLARRQLETDLWEVALTINATARAGEKTIFIVELEHAGLFEVRNISGEQLERLLMVECPALLLPFTRQIIHQATSDGGFPPLLVEPVNFHALFENRGQQPG
jgi:preprotein translocase subunit SecB